ncbi:hypothetical protein [Leisingera sp. ANG-M1]|uniref:hypothetical protein n=1 Tax=Leisingera sp. ANG-M1 TaxID=1577895 RepID=UPI0012699114|nr:hypothetical protein [Leisingera sp. ANG-M1]
MKNSDAYSQRLEQKSIVSSRLSETTRFVAFGIVAWVFAIQTSGADFSKSYISAYEFWINSAGALAVISISCDYFQYLCAYFSVNHALTRRDSDYKYNKNHPAYLLQTLFFIIKQIAVGVAAITTAATFALHIFLN